MMKFNWKASALWLVGASFIALNSYVCGHATCMHQHATAEERNKMCRNELGDLSSKHYIIEAFKDYKRMRDDPCGLKGTGLD